MLSTDDKNLLVTVSDLQFRFGRKEKLFDGLNIQLETGSTALLGPNGAGKSTLINLMLGLLKKQSGEISFLTEGTTLEGNTLKRQLGYLPQGDLIFPGMTALEQVRYAAWSKGIERKSATEVAERALAEVGLLEFANKRAKQLSGGQKRRLGLAMAISNGPKFLVLDEPTSSLDPEQRHIFNSLIAKLAENTLVLSSTHQVEDVIGTYDRVLLINHGRIRFEGSSSQFLQGGNPLEQYVARLSS